MLAVDRWIKKHPEWFDHPRIEIEEGHEGWRQLIDDAFEAVEEVLSQHSGVYFRIVQIKEKFGGLRIYFREEGRPQEASARLGEIMTDAEARSRDICEICGAPACLGLKRSTYSVRCETCAPDGWKPVEISGERPEHPKTP
ncbi:MAG: hypothetical protein ACR650_00100 [Methylocystis sp.]